MAEAAKSDSNGFQTYTDRILQEKILTAFAANIFLSNSNSGNANAASVGNTVFEFDCMSSDNTINFIAASMIMSFVKTGAVTVGSYVLEARDSSGNFWVQCMSIVTGGTDQTLKCTENLFVSSNHYRVRCTAFTGAGIQTIRCGYNAQH